MLRFIFTKIKNKYKLYIALMAGIVSIIAICSVIMMLRQGSLDRLIQGDFVSYHEQSGEFPAVISKESYFEYTNSETGKIEVPDNVYDIVVEEVKKTEAIWDKYLKLPVVNDQRVITFKGRSCDMEFRDRKGYFEVGCIDDDYGGKHFSLMDGTLIKDAKDVPSGCVPCLVSQYTADSYSLVIGEKVVMEDLGDDESAPLVFYITGILKEDGTDDYFWQKSLHDIGLALFVEKDQFSSLAREYNVGRIFYSTRRLYDYRKIYTSNFDDVEGYLKEFKKKDTDLNENITSILAAVKPKATSVKAVLYAIAIPILLLVVIFIGMISVRIINSEQGEIAMLHSRGVTRFRIIIIYLVQSLIIVTVSLLPGLILGFFIGKLIASSTGFLAFSGKVVLGYGMNMGMVYASAAAALFSAIVILLPVIPRSSCTVVENKNKKHASGLPLWEKFFVDILLLGVSIYLLYDYSNQKEALKLAVLSGKGIDPMIFIDATIFLISCGLLILRLVSYLVRFIFKIGKNHLKPAIYAAFVQIIRTRKGSGTISVFLVLTIAMSIFDANMARTINANQEARIRYDVGCDVVISEKWIIRKLTMNSPYLWMYPEPDYDLFQSLVKDGMAESITRVIKDDRAVVAVGKENKVTCTLMGINTKEFGETAKLQPGLTSEHWFNYLNKLSQSSKGVLISRNLADKFKLKEGDPITFARYSPLEDTYIYAEAVGTVVGIVDVFPGYETSRYEYDDKGKLSEKPGYLIVANYTTEVSNFDKTPYSVWIKTDKSEEEIKNYVLEKMQGTKRTLRGSNSINRSIDEMKNSSIIKITNGLFTLNFLVALFLCVLGYLIHWITSIRDRELMFGIYRAMGLSMKEINKMLSMEQLFMSLGPVLAGIGAGTIATILFSGLFAVVYLPENHAVHLTTYVSGADMLRLCIIMLIVIVICFMIIRGIIKKLKIAEALKLGED